LTLLTADLLLLFTSLIWGVAFVAQRLGMLHLGPLYFNGIRFAIGALCLLPLWLWQRAPGKGTEAKASRLFRLGGGALAGTLLFLGATLQQWGLKTTTAGNGGFLTSLYVVIVPLFGIFLKIWPGFGSSAGAVLCLVGAYLLSVTGNWVIEPGDALIIAGSVMWAFHFLALSWLAKKMEPLLLALLQFCYCSAFSLAGASFLESVRIEQVIHAAGPLLFGGVGSVGIGYTLQVIAQRKAPATHAAIILSLEAVFAAIAGGIFLGEHLSARGVVGGLLVFLGVIVAQIWP
jgi:drug/metabolite transporter (DMT)-like permease